MQLSRSQFLSLATVFQGGLAILAFALAWLVGINPFDRFVMSERVIAMGIAGTIPMLVFFVLTYRIQAGPFKDINKFLIEALGPPLAECRWYDLAWVASLAGLSEELLFRAVLQTWMNPWGGVAALLISNLLFGLAHSVTPLYVVLAALLGCYLGGLFLFVGDGNVLVPMVTHAFYDFVAFIIVRRDFLAQESSNKAGIAR